MTQNFDPDFTAVNVQIDRGASMCFNDDATIDFEVMDRTGAYNEFSMPISMMKQMIAEAEAWMVKRETN